LPTIKDVAKAAGVSHGTVSNVLNGYKSVTSDSVKRVEAALKALGYQPNLKARSMRSSRTNCLGVLLPNITDNIYIRLYNGIERIASEAGYSVSLYISNGSPETEEKLLLRMQRQRVDGAVILTCMPGKTEIFDQLLKSGTQMVFVRRKLAGMKGKTFLGIDERRAIRAITTGLLNEGFSGIILLTGRKTFSNEKDCIRGFKEALASFSEKQPAGCLTAQSTADGKESAFRTAVRLLYGETKPQAFITTCPEYAEGIQAAVRMFNLDTPVLTLDNDSWIHTALHYPVIRIAQQYYRLGEETAKKLLMMLEKSQPAKTIILPARPVPVMRLSGRSTRKKSSAAFILQKNKKPLRVLMLENTSSTAARMMKSVFTAETGIPVEIDALPYESMYDAVMGGGAADVVQINIPWIEEAVRRGVIIPLDTLIGMDSGIRSAFSPEILKRHGLCEGILYAVPFLIGTQLLFYRKDLFNDLRVRRLYYEKNKTALEVPATWRDYDKVAEFFTRAFNPESPVLYGTTLGGPSGSYCCIPRLWEAGISLFQEPPPSGGKNARAFLETLEDTLGQYARAFDYADPAAIKWNQAGQAKQFCRGSAAMMVIYQAHFADHVYQHESTIYRENIGFAPLPNRTSVLGGWSLGISAGSVMREKARCFLEWICRDANSVPYNILGGSIPSKIAFNSCEMRETYPWLTPAFDGALGTRSLIDNRIQWISQWEFECLIEEVLYKLVRHKITAKTAAENIQKKLAEIKKRSEIF
jgi:DNA-binding LacI/PurR family transcriptional regulator/ABC-type glycerol-3-phosphate transport system substrate-binding protein